MSRFLLPIILLAIHEKATVQVTQHSAPRFAKDFMHARELADAAWDAERTAWDQLAENRMPVVMWWEVRKAAKQAQEAFDRLVEEYWRDNSPA